MTNALFWRPAFAKPPHIGTVILSTALILDEHAEQSFCKSLILLGLLAVLARQDSN